MGKRSPKFIRLPPAGTFRGEARDTQSQARDKRTLSRVNQSEVMGATPGPWRGRIEARQVVGLGGKGLGQRSRLEVDTHCVGWWASSMQGQGRQRL